MQGTHRMRGFINAYMAHPEISYLNKTIMYQSGQDMTKVLKQVSTIMSQPEHPTAVVCYNDELADPNYGRDSLVRLAHSSRRQRHWL